ncbi:CHAT domain-containing protein [Suillus clintonianus]|uniref:CHAT domain-containing protein n=1 Tax=Suillus clintonianus TaxID=1904413 RepID=UPI001B8859C3|nr:CHAT domain-containing protein [Suillus clintonianus]KAG2146264.1 CHAT domain-containing protein [Suillus clintonianus]
MANSEDGNQEPTRDHTAVGDELYALFGHQDDLQVLQLAIGHYNAALTEDVPDSQRSRSDQLLKLGTALSRRFDLVGDTADLDVAINCHSVAIDLLTPDSPDVPIMRVKYAQILMKRFKLHLSQSDLDLAIEEYACISDKNDPTHKEWLVALADALVTRFSCRGNTTDLSQAIHLYESVVNFDASNAPTFVLGNLSLAHFFRYQQEGDAPDLTSSIAYSTKALGMISSEDQNRSVLLNNVANGLLSRFKKLGSTDDLEQAIKFYDSVLELCPAGHKGRLHALSNLAGAMMTRYEFQASLADIEVSVGYFHEALEICPRNHPDRSTLLDNLATTLRERFKLTGDIVDLETAIENHYEALHNLPQFHPHRCHTLCSLGNALQSRFAFQGDPDDLNAAVDRYSEALRLQSPSHPGRADLLNNLANVACKLFKERGNPHNLDVGIKYYSEALQFSPEGYHRPLLLHNFASALTMRFTCYNRPEDLDRALELAASALELRERSTESRLSSLVVLANAKGLKYELDGDPSILQAAFQHLDDACGLCTPGHPSLVDIWEEYSRIHLYAYSNAPQSKDHLEEAFRYFRLASTHISGGSLPKFCAAQRWAKEAEAHKHSSALDAHQVALGIFDHHITTKPSVESRHRIVRYNAASLAADAASCALKNGLITLAVEILEHGRGLLWTYLARFRTPLDDLQSTGEHGCRLAAKFLRLSPLLEDAACGAVTEEGLQHYRCLLREWDGVVDQIRLVDGFGDFLLAPSFSKLKEAAKNGPIIITNASKYSCDAIIVHHKHDPIHIPLTDINISDILRLSSQFRDFTKIPGTARSKERHLTDLLRQIWDTVVLPVVGELESSLRIPKGSRIWWCPTSNFNSIPLHAAASFRKGEKGLLNHYISSYTPTLSALLRCQKPRHTLNDKNPPQILAIGQAAPAGDFAKLGTVDEELDSLQSILPPTIPMTRMTGENATRSESLRAIHSSAWVHLACHGKQDAARPLKSCFAMSDGPLALLDIVRASSDSVPCSEFAFLSACHTAAGDRTAPDEVVHLAAAMQFAGFRGVVGTMWAVDDAVAVNMVSAFYEALLEKSPDGLNSEHAAAALNAAAKKVDKSIVPLEQRIVFIHIGA